MLLASEVEHFGYVCTSQQPAGHWLVLVSRGVGLLVGHSKDSWQIIVRRDRDGARPFSMFNSQPKPPTTDRLTACNFCASARLLFETQPLFTLYIYYSGNLQLQVLDHFRKYHMTILLDLNAKLGDQTFSVENWKQD
jgi:hypothetical protein